MKKIKEKMDMLGNFSYSNPTKLYFGEDSLNYLDRGASQVWEEHSAGIWSVDPAGKRDEEIAAEGLEKMGQYMQELGLVMNISDLGVTKDMIEGIADSTFIMEGGYKILTHEEIVDILQKSL